MKSSFQFGSVLFFALFISTFSFAQTIRGTVSDEISGETLIGANVIYAPGKGVVTDFDGNYELKLSAGEYDITISYVGYITVVKHILLKGSDVRLNVELGIETLNEVTVMAEIAKGSS